jgi:hypothetical protein
VTAITSSQETGLNPRAMGYRQHGGSLCDAHGLPLNVSNVNVWLPTQIARLWEVQWLPEGLVRL